MSGWDGALSLVDGTRIDGKFNGWSAFVGDFLTMEGAVFGGPVLLRDTHVEGQMSMNGASVADQQPFDADRLLVGRDFVASADTFGGALHLAGLTVDGALDLRDSHVRELDLTGAVVRDDILLGGEGFLLHWPLVAGRPTCEGPAPCLILRNARVGNLQDDELAWPDRITLEGFGYTHLGGIGGKERQDMRNRSVEWWRDWLSRDRSTAPSPTRSSPAS
jgi:hypothetical protein